MFSWFSEKPRKTAIRTLRIYDGIKLVPKIAAADSAVTANSVKSLKASPKQHAWDTKTQDNLSGVPRILIRDIEPPEHLEAHDVDIICEVTYVFDPPRIKNNNTFSKLAMFLLAWSFIGLIILILFGAIAANQQQIDARCYYYTKQGVPDAITINGATYKLKADGSLDPIDRAFLNPYDEVSLRAIDYDDCITINTR